MKALKRAVSLLAVALLLSAVCLPLAGCDGKRDVSIRLKSTTRTIPPYTESTSRTWVFPVGTDEIHDEIEYTGKAFRIIVDAYCLQGKLTWVSPDHSGPNVFEIESYLYTDLNGKQHKVESILDRGTYMIRCSADSSSTLWHYRRVRLFLTVI